MAVPIRRKHVEPEEGEYEAELASVRLEDAQITPGESHPYVRFTFKVLDGEALGKTVDASVPNNFVAGSKLDGILRGFGVDINTTEELDAERLVGQRIRVLVEHKTSKRGSVFPSVSKTKPTRRPAPQTPRVSTPVTSGVAQDEDVPL